LEVSVEVRFLWAGLGRVPNFPMFERAGERRGWGMYAPRMAAE